MKTDAAQPIYSATKLGAILKRHAPSAPPSPSSDAIAALVYAFLLWEASTHQANAAIERLMKECVDFNELRVCLPEEIAGILGSRYPFVEERAHRMRRSLNDIFRREHKVSLEHLTSAGKREQRSYLEGLDGMVGFVASRLLLLHFGHPVVPVDDQLVDLLREAKILQRDEVAAADLAGALAKAASSLEEALKTHHALVTWVDVNWNEDPSAIMKSKKVRLLTQRAAEARELKAREEAARVEAARAEAARIEEEKAAAAAKKAARAAARSIEAKPSKGESAKPASKPAAKPATKPVLGAADKKAEVPAPKAGKPVAKGVRVVKAEKPAARSPAPKVRKGKK